MVQDLGNGYYLYGEGKMPHLQASLAPDLGLQLSEQSTGLRFSRALVRSAQTNCITKCLATLPFTPMLQV